MKKMLSALLLAATMLTGAVSAHAQDSKPKYGGTLTYLEQQAHYNLFPTNVGQYPNGNILNQLLDRLTYQNPETLEIEPWIATSWEISDDYTQYTFHLREGVTYSDGTPLDAANVVRNFDEYGRGNPDLKHPVSEVIANYVGGEALDDLTVRFTFSKPAPGFLQGTSVIISGLLANASLDRPLDDFGDIGALIGSGPFVSAGYTNGSNFKLVAREDYNWGPVKHEHQGRAYLDEIRVVVMPEDGVRIGALLSGQGDVLRHLQAYDEQAVLDAGFQLYSPSAHGLNNSVVIRPDNEIVADVRVRKALLRGTNVPEIIQTLFSDNYRQARSILTSSVAGFIDLSDELTYDPELAVRLLEEAGWAVGPDGVRVKDGQDLALRIYESNSQPQNRAHLQLLAQQWEAIGVKLEVLAGDAGSRAVDNLDPSRTAVRSAMIGRADPEAMLAQYHPSNRNLFLQVDGKNEAVKGFIDPTLNGLLEAIASEADPAKRLEHVAAAQRHVIDNAYAIPFFEEPQVFAAGPDVHGFNFEAVARPSFYATWLDR